MKSDSSPLNHRLMILFAVSFAFTAILLSGANLYAGQNDAEAKTVVKASLTERMDAHFAVLHEKLKITTAQEDQWRAFTRVMTDNAKAMQELQEKRQKEAGTMNALEDLKSYSIIADSHADGLKKFIPAFESLYSSMSEEQKRNADSLFREQRETMVHQRAAK